MGYEIVSAKKSKLTDEDKVRSALAQTRPNFVIENIEDRGDEWLVRLRTADVPPFLKKKDEDAGSDSSDSGISDDSDAGVSDDDSDSSGDDTDDDSSSGDSSDSKDKKHDPVKEVERIIGDLQGLLGELGGKTKELQDAHQEKEDKLKDIADTVGGPGDEVAPPLPADIGPTPTPKAPPAGPGGALRPPRRPGVPSGGAPRPGLPTAFTKRRTEVVNHPGVDDKGQRITLLAAASALESDPEWSDYEVAGMTVNADGTFAAKLKLRS
jgi:hypothetical protein